MKKIMEVAGKVVGKAGGALKFAGIAILTVGAIGTVLVLGSKASGEDEVYVESEDVTPTDTENTDDETTVDEE